MFVSFRTISFLILLLLQESLNLKITIAEQRLKIVFRFCLFFTAIDIAQFANANHGLGCYRPAMYIFMYAFNTSVIV
jgi:hypothetical protein